MNKLITIALTLITIIAIAIGGFFTVAKFAPSSLMSKDLIQPAASQFFDAKGALLATTDSEEDRIPVSIDKIPQDLQNAFLAAEDIRFYQHSGIDFRGIARALITNIFGADMQGGSTITQQLAKNAFLTQERTITRKIQEAFIAIQMEQKYTKREILEMYLNQIYFGQGAYGVESAALKYFGKHIQDLDLAQCAMLAGLPKSPNYYSPLDNPKAGTARQHVVIDQMLKYGFITAEQAKETKAEKLVYNSTVDKKGSMDYFVEYCTQLLIEKFGPDAVFKQGLKVYTTLDQNMQNAAENAVQQIPTYYTDDNKLKQPQVALVAIDPQTGFIKAMIGGRGTDKFNRAILAERQPGSAFKPFVYLAALDKGATPATIIDDKPLEFAKSWDPQNYDRRWHGKVSLRTALVYSYNIPAVLMANEVGPNTVIDYARKLGISTLVTNEDVSDENLAMALGGLTRGVTPLEMASAYGVLANSGEYNTPIAIIKVVDRDGKVLLENKVKSKQVVNPKTVYTLVDILKEVMTRGTGGGANIPRTCAGKTGTTNDYKDAWFVGFTPDLSASVWIGDDNGEPLEQVTGGDIPASIWHDFMIEALADIPASNFVRPAGVTIPDEPKIDNSKKTTTKKDIKTGKIPGAITKDNIPQPPKQNSIPKETPTEKESSDAKPPIVSNKPTRPNN